MFVPERFSQPSPQVSLNGSPGRGAPTGSLLAQANDLGEHVRGQPVGAECEEQVLRGRVARRPGGEGASTEPADEERIRLDDVVGQGFEALLDPAATQLKILIDIRN